jgi:hypothetical protein
LKCGGNIGLRAEWYGTDKEIKQGYVGKKSEKEAIK